MHDRTKHGGNEMRGTAVTGVVVHVVFAGEARLS